MYEVSTILAGITTLKKKTQLLNYKKIVILRIVVGLGEGVQGIF